jgi:hypothetical protein
MKITMKKSILLNEDEKSRILNLHETAKNLYENKKPVSSIKEDKSKKENMKKVIKLTESDLEKIVRRVIEEQYMGVAFGGEQNGLQIKKMETKEQIQGAVAQSTNVAAKPKVDQATISKIQSTFPKPHKDTTTGKLSFDRGEDSPKYDNLVKFIKSYSYGNQAVDASTIRMSEPVAAPNEINAMNQALANNNRLISALYDGIQAVMTNGFAKALDDPKMKALGSVATSVRDAADDYLKKIGINAPA